MKVHAFTISRANTAPRAKLLLDTITSARDTAGQDFNYHLYCEQNTLAHEIGKTAVATGHLQYVHTFPTNVGQHPAHNAAQAYAQAEGYDFLLRLDDDCEFLSKQWLAKLIKISACYDHKAILTPAVRGLKHSPPRSLEADRGIYKVEYLLEAIGGICRLHPVALLCNAEAPYVSDIRLPLGSGDATGIGAWCQMNLVPMVWCKNVRVKHSTKEQEAADVEHFVTHNLLQRIPYIPPMPEGWTIIPNTPIFLDTYEEDSFKVKS